jgi:branched-chain amino acid transport system substrate-binding protein
MKVALAAATAWGLAASAAQAADTIKLVEVGPMSGANGFQGEVMRNGAQLAIDQANAQGGIHGKRIEFIVLDDQNDKKLAGDKAKEAVASGALAVLGHRSSSATVAAGKVYKESHIPAITGSAAAPDVTLGNPWYFRLLSDTAAQAEILGSYATSVLHAKSATLIVEDSEYGSSLADAFKEKAQVYGIAIETEYHYPEKIEDAKKHLVDHPVPTQKVGRDHLIVLAAPEATARFVLPKIRDAGDQSTILAGQSVGKETFNQHFKDLPRDHEKHGFYSDGVIATTAGLNDTAGAEARRFLKAYKDKFGQEGDATAMAYYDSAMLVIQGLREIHATGDDIPGERAKLRDYMESRKGPDSAYMGAGGRIYFDANHSAVQTIPIGRFVDGMFIAAPYQLEKIRNPDKVPDFEAELKAGHIVELDGSHLSKVQVVYAGMDIIEITDINMRAGNFKADMFLWFRYQGELKPSDLEFVNAATPINLGNPIWTRKRGETTTATYRVKGTFKADFDYKDYPFDRQTLPISLRHRARPTSTFILAVDRLGLNVTDRSYDSVVNNRLDRVFAGTSWKPMNPMFYQTMVESESTLGETGLRMSEIGMQYAQVTNSLDIRRDVVNYFIKNALPLLLILAVLYAAYYVPADQVAIRVNIGITSLLTSMVLYQRLSSDLPSIGYLVMMDYIFFGVFVMAILGVAAGVLVFIANKNKQERLVLGINLGGRLLIPSVVLGTGIFLYRLI